MFTQASHLVVSVCQAFTVHALPHHVSTYAQPIMTSVLDKCVADASRSIAPCCFEV